MTGQEAQACAPNHDDDYGDRPTRRGILGASNTVGASDGGGADVLLGAVERRLRDIGATRALATFQRLSPEELEVLVRREMERPIVEVT